MPRATVEDRKEKFKWKNIGEQEVKTMWPYVLGGFFAGVVVGIFSIYGIAIFAGKTGFLDDDDDKE